MDNPGCLGKFLIVIANVVVYGGGVWICMWIGVEIMKAIGIG